MTKTKKFLFCLEGTIEAIDAEEAREDLEYRMESLSIEYIKYGLTLMQPDFLQEKPKNGKRERR